MPAARSQSLLLTAFAALHTCAGPGCNKPTDRSDTPAPPSAPAVASSAPSPAGPSAAASAGPEVKALSVPIALRTIAARDIPQGGWMPEFTLQREVGDEGLTFVAAAARCMDNGLALCTSTQWRLACEADPGLGTLETWTASYGLRGGLVIQGGGGGGCAGSRTALGSGMSPFRAGVCCSRAVAIQTSKPPTAVMKSTAAKLVAFENALNRRSSLAVRELVEDPIQFHRTKLSRQSAGGVFDGYFRAHPDFWAIHDKCDVTFQREEDTWTADCRKMTQQDGKIGDTVTRYLWGGTSAKIRSITDVQVLRELSDP